MSCPKCKAKIGIVHQKLATQVGIVFGIMCLICGCWVQSYPGLDEIANRPLDGPA